MRAIQYRKSLARYFAVRAFGPRLPRLCTSALGCLRWVEMDPPVLPSERWVRVHATLTGICGSDLATIRAEGSAYFSPLTSTPFVLGHEVVGVVSESKVDRLPVGARVVLEPALHCAVRGIAPVCARCADGHYGNCENVTKGDLAPGIQTGYCRDTGGGWSESFIAHECQLYRVPDELSDETAVLAEPLACALHAVLSVQPGDLLRPQAAGANAPASLVIGCGTMGLLCIAALRATGVTADIVAVAKHPHQGALAFDLGATDVLYATCRATQQLRQRFNAQLYQPEIGGPTVIGGAETTFDCVGSSASIAEALRFTRARGDVVLVGMPGVPRGLDWTAIWYKELRVRGSYTYGWETWKGARRRTFEIALELLCANSLQLGQLVTHRYSLLDYRDAVGAALSTGVTKSVKTVMALDPTHE